MGELSGLRVSDLMDRRPVCATPDLPLTEFVLDHALRCVRLELLVLDHARLAGIVTFAAARKIPVERWGTMTVADAMVKPPLVSLHPDESIEEVLELLAQSAFARLPVLDGGRVVGALGRDDVARFTSLRGLLHFEQPGRVDESSATYTRRP